MNYKSKETKRIEKLKRVDKLLNIDPKDIEDYTDEDMNILLAEFASTIAMCSAYHGNMIRKGNATLVVMYKKYMKMLSEKRKEIVQWYEDKVILEEMKNVI